MQLRVATLIVDPRIINGPSHRPIIATCESQSVRRLYLASFFLRVSISLRRCRPDVRLHPSRSSRSGFLRDRGDVPGETGLVYRVPRSYRRASIGGTRAERSFKKFFYDRTGMNQPERLNWPPRPVELFMDLRQLVVPLFSETMNDDVDGFAATSCWFLPRLVSGHSQLECLRFPRASLVPFDSRFETFHQQLFTIPGFVNPDTPR